MTPFLLSLHPSLLPVPCLGGFYSKLLWGIIFIVYSRTFTLLQLTSITVSVKKSQFSIYSCICLLSRDLFIFCKSPLLLLFLFSCYLYFSTFLFHMRYIVILKPLQSMRALAYKLTTGLISTWGERSTRQFRGDMQSACQVPPTILIHIIFSNYLNRHNNNMG